MLEGLIVVRGVLSGAGDVSLPCDARLVGTHGVVATVADDSLCWELYSIAGVS